MLAEEEQLGLQQFNCRWLQDVTYPQLVDPRVLGGLLELVLSKLLIILLRYNTTFNSVKLLLDGGSLIWQVLILEIPVVHTNHTSNHRHCSLNSQDWEKTIQGQYDAVLDTIGVPDTERIGINILKRGGSYMTLQVGC